MNPFKTLKMFERMVLWQREVAIHPCVSIYFGGGSSGFGSREGW